MPADDGKAPRRPRRPVLAVAATAIGGAAIVGYSGYWFADAVGKFEHCNPPPPTLHCSTFSFWGFSPTFFLLASIVGFVAGGLLVVLAFVLWANPRHHVVLGGVIFTLSLVSLLAYGGYYAGFAAGVAGGILAVLYRPPRFREISQWTGTRYDPHPERRPTPSRAATPTSLDPEVYAPMPPAQRVRPPPALGSPASGPMVRTPAPVSSAGEGSLVRYGNLASALGARSPEPTPAPRPAPSPRSGPPPLPTSTPSAPPVVPGRSVPAPPPAAKPAAAPASGPSTPPPSPPAVPSSSSSAATPARTMSWKCSQCGLTNAPWSRSCTRCQTPSPSG